MKRVSRRVDGAIILVCAALIALVFATGVLGKTKTWGYMEYRNLVFRQGTPLLSTADGAQYGIQNVGPGLDLARGTYRFKYWVDTDGAGEIRFSSDNQAGILPEGIRLEPGQAGSETITLEILDDATNVQFLIDFESGTFMNVNEVRLYGGTYADNAFTFAFLMASACLLWLLWRHGLLTAQRRGRLVLIGAAILVVSAPVLKENFSVGHDAYYHMARIMNLADGLRSGQFPVRAGGFTYNGYGAITSVFYPDLLLYPFAMMVNAGASIQYVMSALCIAQNIAAAITMYVCAKRMVGGEWAATCASVLYVCAAYRLASLYVRCAVGESLALSLFPLFILGLWEVIFGDSRRWRLLVLSASAIFMCHIISTLLCATMALCLGAVFLPRILREGRMGAILKSMAATALLCLFFLLPLATYSLQGVNADAINVFQIADTSLAPAQLFLQGAGDLSVDPADVTLSGYPVELGLPLILGAALLLFAFAASERRGERPMKAAMLALILGIAAAWMATTAFPWRYVSKVTGLYDRIQFAWRLIGPACAMLSLAAGYGYAQLEPKNGKPISAAVLALALVMVMPTINAHTRSGAYSEFGEGADAAIVYQEYNLPGTDVRMTTDRAAHAQDGVSFDHFIKDGTSITLEVAAGEAGIVSLPLFGFDGYAAELDGERLETGLGENNRLTVAIPEGKSGTLRVWFEGKVIWRIGDGISLLTAAALILSAVRGHETKRRQKIET